MAPIATDTPAPAVAELEEGVDKLKVDAPVHADEDDNEESADEEGVEGNGGEGTAGGEAGDDCSRSKC